MCQRLRSTVVLKVAATAALIVAFLMVGVHWYRAGIAASDVLTIGPYPDTASARRAAFARLVSQSARDSGSRRIVVRAAVCPAWVYWLHLCDNDYDFVGVTYDRAAHRSTDFDGGGEGWWEGVADEKLRIVAAHHGVAFDLEKLGCPAGP